MPAARAVAAELGVAARGRVGVESRADVVVLAVKPNQLAAVLPSAAPTCRGAVYLSIAAGKTIAQLEAGLGAGTAIVRAMPNTPAAIGKGMTVLVANAAASARAARACAASCSRPSARSRGSTTSATWTPSPRSPGSGPAYVFLLIECLERAGVELGLDAALAQQLALATVAGAGAYAGPPARRPRSCAGA